jgi:hypothetical protein
VTNYIPCRGGTDFHYCYPDSKITLPLLKQFGMVKVRTLPMAGDARGAEGQQLVVPGAQMKPASRHDAELVGTMGDKAYCWDADSQDQLWEVTLGRPIKSNGNIDENTINDFWGELSTGALVAGGSRKVGCFWGSLDGTVVTAAFHAYLQDVATGAVIQSVSLEGVTYQPPANAPKQLFKSAERKQRAGLTPFIASDDKEYVAIPFGSLVESSKTARGWVVVVSVNADKLAVAAAITTTVKGFGGGVWQSGGAMPWDKATQSLFGVTGNGTFDPPTDLGNCCVRIKFTPAGGRADAALAVTGWCTGGYTDSGVMGGAAGGEDMENPPPTNARRWAEEVHEGLNDLDLGSAPPLVIPELRAVVFGGKTARLFMTSMDKMPNHSQASLDPANNVALKASYAAAPIWGTFFPGYQYDPVPADQTQIGTFYLSMQTHHLHAAIAYYKSLAKGHLIYVWGENGNLRCFQIIQNGPGAAYPFALKYLACSVEVASINCQGTTMGGMPGGMCIVTHDPNGENGILWAKIPYGDANKAVTQGRLLAYAADEFGMYADGSSSMPAIWDSQASAIPFMFNKFGVMVPPGNGEIHMPDYSGGILILRLGTPPPPP